MSGFGQTDPVQNHGNVQESSGQFLANASQPIRTGCQSDPACLLGGVSSVQFSSVPFSSVQDGIYALGKAHTYVGDWGWGVEGKQVGSMDEESQVRGCYNITFICTPTNQETV